jgi:hypothetical protein
MMVNPLNRKIEHHTIVLLAMLVGAAAGVVVGFGTHSWPRDARLVFWRAARLCSIHLARELLRAGVAPLTIFLSGGGGLRNIVAAHTFNH